MNLLDDAADNVYKKLKAVGGNPQNLHATLRPIAILYHVQGMVDNGGLRYLFESDLSFEVPYAIVSGAYRSIGAHDAADTFDKAVALFPFDNPEQNEEARRVYMEDLDENHEMIVLGNKVCGDKSIWEKMEEYVKLHRAEFDLPII